MPTRVTPRRFPPPWTVDDPDTKLGQDCYIVRNANGHALAYVYFEDEPGRRSAAKMLTRDEARRIAAELPKVARKAEITLESLSREAAEIQSAATSAKQYAAANSALKLKAELSGHYVQRRELDVTPRRSASEIDDRLRELLTAGDQAGGAAITGRAPSPRDSAELH
jgi:hypothetical protein